MNNLFIFVLMVYWNILQRTSNVILKVLLKGLHRLFHLFVIFCDYPVLLYLILELLIPVTFHPCKI
jgi:hypothetical protein